MSWNVSASARAPARGERLPGERKVLWCWCARALGERLPGERRVLLEGNAPGRHAAAFAAAQRGVLGSYNRRGALGLAWEPNSQAWSQRSSWSSWPPRLQIWLDSGAWGAALHPPVGRLDFEPNLILNCTRNGPRPRSGDSQEGYSLAFGPTLSGSTFSSYAESRKRSWLPAMLVGGRA